MSDLVAKNLVSRPDLPKGQTTLSGFTSTKIQANGNADAVNDENSSIDEKESATSTLDIDGDTSMIEGPDHTNSVPNEVESSQGSAAATGANNTTSSPVIRRHSLMDLIED